MKSVAASPMLPSNDWRRLQEVVRELSEALNQVCAGQQVNSVRGIAAAYTSSASTTYIGLSPAGVFTLTLPAASACKDVEIIVKRENSNTSVITIQSSSGNIDGAASVTLTTAYQVRRFVSDGANFFTV